MIGFLLQQLINALSLGSTYALLALGLAMVFSILGLVNFAHGELVTQPLTGFLLFTFFIFAFLLVLILLYVYQAELLDMVTE